MQLRHPSERAGPASSSAIDLGNSPCLVAEEEATAHRESPHFKKEKENKANVQRRVEFNDKQFRQWYTRGALMTFVAKYMYDRFFDEFWAKIRPIPYPQTGLNLCGYGGGKRRTGGAGQAVIMRHCGNGTNQRILPSRQLFFSGVWPTLLYERELRSTTEFPIRRIYPTTPIINTGWAESRGLGFGFVLSTAVLKTGHVFGIPKKSGFVGDTLGMWAGGRFVHSEPVFGVVVAIANTRQSVSPAPHEYENKCLERFEFRKCRFYG